MLRYSDKIIESHFSKHAGQALLLLGARQVGKTTILKRIFPEAQYFLLDNEPVRKAFETYDINSYRQFLSPKKHIVIIDEIHLLSNPGRAAKIIHDQMPGIKLIITGSSALHIKNHSSESMAGRKVDYYLFPLTFSEYLYQTEIEKKLNNNFLQNIIDVNHKSVHLFDLQAALKHVLTFGLNPYLIDHPSNVEYIKELANSAIFKDILELNLIENRRVATDLLKLLAHQVGNLINYSEIASRLNCDHRTVMRYISIFEQSFIIFRLTPFVGNKRDEVGKAPKIYFYDIGLRNAIINDFSDPFLRRDFGSMFENFIISEIYKHNSYEGNKYQMNFWRTTQGSEVDLILSQGNDIIGCKIKANKTRISTAFTKRYPGAKYKVITTKNFY